MTETLRYGLICKEDLSIGTGNLETRLADGRVVTLQQVDIGDILNDPTLYTAIVGLTLSRTIGVVNTLDRDVTTADVTDSVTETTVYSFSVPANTLGTNRAIRLTMIGDYLNNSGTTALCTLRVKFGGTTLFNLTPSLTANADRRDLHIRCMISALNATNSQVASLYMRIGSPTTAGAAPITPGGAAVTNEGYGVVNSLAIDSTAAQTLAVSFEHGTQNPNISARSLVVQLEWLN